MGMQVLDVFPRGLKRGRRVVNGRAESRVMIRTSDKINRRVYEDWTRLNKHGSRDTKKWTVPFVVMVKGEPIDLPDDLVAHVNEMNS